MGVDMPSAKQELEHVMRGVGGTAVCQDITHSQVRRAVGSLLRWSLHASTDWLAG